MVTSLDEPYAGGLPSWFVFKGMANKVKVCMTGTGGDELFGNYGKWRVYEHPVEGIRQAIGFARRDCRWITDLNRFPLGSRYSMYFREYEKRKIVCRTEWSAACESSEALIERLWMEGSPASIRDAPRIIDMQIQLPDEFLHMTDRFSMAFSIEARPPFLDREFAEKMMSIPAKERMGKTKLKAKLIEALHVYIPDELLNARKQGFVLPISQWLRKDLRHRVQSLLSPSYLRRQGIFKEGLYQEIVLPHLEGRRDNSSKLWTLFMFQLWYDRHLSQ
jgi:asparagine synthase (glutamine-hydrolysing)